VSGPYRSPDASGTEHDVWKPNEPPLPIVVYESAENDPDTVNVDPSVTGNVWPFIVTVVAAGNVPVNWPYALLPCWFTFAPWLV
jgi:hypothetical protein